MSILWIILDESIASALATIPVIGKTAIHSVMKNNLVHPLKFPMHTHLQNSIYTLIFFLIFLFAVQLENSVIKSENVHPM